MACSFLYIRLLCKYSSGNSTLFNQGKHIRNTLSIAMLIGASGSDAGLGWRKGAPVAQDRAEGTEGRHSPELAEGRGPLGGRSQERLAALALHQRWQGPPARRGRAPQGTVRLQLHLQKCTGYLLGTERGLA